MACLAIPSLSPTLSSSVMELAVLAKWLLPEIMEFAAWALLMTAKSQVSGFRKGLNNSNNSSNNNNDINNNRKCFKCCCDNSSTARLSPHALYKIALRIRRAYIVKLICPICVCVCGVAQTHTHTLYKCGNVICHFYDTFGWVRGNIK